MGNVKRPPTEQELTEKQLKDEILKLHDGGNLGSKIARQLGISSWRVYNIINTYRPKKSPKPDDSDLERRLRNAIFGIEEPEE